MSGAKSACRPRPRRSIVTTSVSTSRGPSGYVGGSHSARRSAASSSRSSSEEGLVIKIGHTCHGLHALGKSKLFDGDVVVEATEVADRQSELLAATHPSGLHPPGGLCLGVVRHHPDQCRQVPQRVLNVVGQLLRERHGHGLARRRLQPGREPLEVCLDKHSDDHVVPLRRWCRTRSAHPLSYTAVDDDRGSIPCLGLQPDRVVPIPHAKIVSQVGDRFGEAPINAGRVTQRTCPADARTPPPPEPRLTAGTPRRSAPHLRAARAARRAALVDPGKPESCGLLDGALASTGLGATLAAEREVSGARERLLQPENQPSHVGRRDPAQLSVRPVDCRSDDVRRVTIVAPSTHTRQIRRGSVPRDGSARAGITYRRPVEVR